MEADDQVHLLLLGKWSVTLWCWMELLTYSNQTTSIMEGIFFDLYYWLQQFENYFFKCSGCGLRPFNAVALETDTSGKSVRDDANCPVEFCLRCSYEYFKLDSGKSFKFKYFYTGKQIDEVCHKALEYAIKPGTWNVWVKYSINYRDGGCQWRTTFRFIKNEWRIITRGFHELR